MPQSIVLSPPPVFFIKSISEQGYSLSTAVADLVDNSVTAGARRVELLINANVSPLRLYIADNGSGMTGDELSANMRFPSADLEAERAGNDLGRFGLGLKTGSFSQSRRFTLLSSKTGMPYEARTWDVEYLKETKDWTLIVDSKEATEKYLEEYNAISSDFHGQSNDFIPRTIVIWDNLYKLERLKKQSEINDELEELRSHLGLVFHRFLQSGRLEIRLNNSMVTGFDPFPVNADGVQQISENYWQTADAYVRFQGIILPKRAAVEVKEPDSIWAPAGKSLDECQGMFVYRNERLISYGLWLRALPKAIWLQFARIKIDITNTNDSEFHINVAKSSLKLPFGLKRAMAEMVIYVAGQASKEYRERLASGVIRNPSARNGLSLISRESTASGPVLRISHDFELIRQLENQLTTAQVELLHTITGLIEKKLNQVWKGDAVSSSEIEEGLTEQDRQKITRLKKYYEEADYSTEEIREFLFESFGHNSVVTDFLNTLS
ncbi:ATP-binding protein [Mucilaginibacter sp. HD30]